ncbi:uncharacterized protein LOC126214768 [Schistocerca nitens]|uniref:uncharacterized protein LOC126214768 n=1 Tax=Schistocerca nitens TaxID=7011 RepID=UPI0021183223|nr:uncharacterized protein LOC126214768 [Schistocerca nitens]
MAAMKAWDIDPLEAGAAASSAPAQSGARVSGSSTPRRPHRQPQSRGRHGPPAMRWSTKTIPVWNNPNSLHVSVQRPFLVYVLDLTVISSRAKHGCGLYGSYAFGCHSCFWLKQEAVAVVAGVPVLQGAASVRPCGVEQATSMATIAPTTGLRLLDNQYVLLSPSV